jgi:hypothetical protein
MPNPIECRARKTHNTAVLKDGIRRLVLGE